MRNTFDKWFLSSVINARNEAEFANGVACVGDRPYVVRGFEINVLSRHPASVRQPEFFINDDEEVHNRKAN